MPTGKHEDVFGEFFALGTGLRLIHQLVIYLSITEVAYPFKFIGAKEKEGKKEEGGRAKGGEQDET